MYDTVIQNGLIADGTGKDSYTADIGIVDGKIAKIGVIAPDMDVAGEVIDAAGKRVTPGFIDVHSHGDGTILMYPNAESEISQGITTFVGGTCGDSPAPISEKYYMRHFWEYDAWYDVDKHTYYANFVQPREKAISVLEERYPIKFDYRTYDDYLKKVEKIKPAPNFIPFLGHGTIRAHSMGPVNAFRQPDEAEIAQMKIYIREAMEAGAWGFSTGLDYPPSAYAETGEIVTLLETVAKYGGIYSTHWRRTGIRQGTPKRNKKIDGIIEACEIGRQSSVRVEISHLMPGFDIFPDIDADIQRAVAKATLKVIDAAVADGVNVAFNVIPNTTAGFECTPFLAMYMAPWVRISGGLEHFIENLMSADFRKELTKILREGGWYKLNPLAKPEWDRSMIVTQSANPTYENKSLEDIAQNKKMDSLDTVFELLLEDPRIGVRQDSKNEASIREFLMHERAMVCVDSYVYDTIGPFGHNTDFPEILPHPTAYCAFPRYILNFPSARFEDTIRKLTGWPAEWYGLTHRGVIKEGNFADIVVLDMENLKTNENHVEPRQFSEGIEHVLINGVSAVKSGIITSCRPGKVLRLCDPSVL